MFRFRLPSSDYGVLLHQIFALISSIYGRVAMVLQRSESVKWIRKRFSFYRANNLPHNFNDNKNTEHSTRATTTTAANITTETTTTRIRPPETSGNLADIEAGEYYNKAKTVLKNNNENYLAEVFVVNDMKIDAPATTTLRSPAPPPPPQTVPQASIDMQQNAVMSGRCNATSATDANTSNSNNNNYHLALAAAATAPIAREEEVEGGYGESNDDDGDDENYVCCRQYETKAGKITTSLTKEASTASMMTMTTPMTVQRSKSRVRTYLKKCKERLTGQHHQQQQQPQQQQQQQQHHEQQQRQQHEETPTLIATEIATHKTIDNDDERQIDMEKRTPPTITTAKATTTTTTSTLILTKTKTTDVATIFGIAEEDENDNRSYEDIDFGLTTSSSSPTTMSDNNVGLRTTTTTTTTTNSGFDDADVAVDCGLLAEIDAQQAAMQQAALNKEALLARAIQLESSVAAMIDRHLSHIYPVYWATTRAILIRQARDLLVCSFHGCLQSFEQNFLCKFSEIAIELRAKHIVGESILWQEGWPLATPTGKLILHLGALDDEQLKPAEIYLCVKTVKPSVIPELYAVWRTAKRDAIVIQSQRINYSEPKAAPTTTTTISSNTYLSILSLEMLSVDELPQLLQNLLVSVERSVERISLNELQMPIGVTSAVGDVGNQKQQQQHQKSMSLTVDEININCINNHNNHNNNHNHNNINITNFVPNSPKCALRRSELITKNKLFSNRYMLRRLTNRQDSMNSTSSGNSCNSSGSASSDELLQHKNNNSDTTTGGMIKSEKSISPALPMFCLGNSFPHIDSDEENADEKRNSIEGDAFECEILPPTSISEIPEKLLTSGIYLPGTRSLNGDPLVTIDAECVAGAGLNCYEIATVLLFYNSITESNLSLTAATITTTSTTSTPSTAIITEKHLPLETTATLTTSQTTSTASATTNPAQQQQQQTFTILIAIDKSQHLCVIDLICQSLKLLKKQIGYCEILVVCLERNLLQLCKKNDAATDNTNNNNNNNKESQSQQQQQQQQHLVKFISVDEVTTSVAPSTQIPNNANNSNNANNNNNSNNYNNTNNKQLQQQPPFGMLHHDARKWREFFIQLEPFQRQCTAAGQRLVTAMSDIRSADLQGLPTRRQLYAQHRALSRALMDSELHNLRKHGMATLTRLQEIAKMINTTNSNNSNNNTNSTANLPTNKTTMMVANKYSSGSSNYSFNTAASSSASSTMTISSSHNSSTVKSNVVTSQQNNNNNNKTTTTTVLSASHHQVNSSSTNNNNNNTNIDVAIRLHKVTLLFNEVDRAAKRLEQLTEQRRERLRQLTRQRALEEEINEVTSWINSDGNETLQKFMNLSLDCATDIKAQEHEFEKYYFISMKHLAKGRDLHAAAAELDVLKESAKNLKSALDSFAEKLEKTRERIEGAVRLHHLLSQHHIRDEALHDEAQRLAEQIGVSALLEKYRAQQKEHELETTNRVKPNTLNLNSSNRSISKGHVMVYSTSTPMSTQKLNRSSYRSSSGNGSFEGQACHCWRESRNLEDMDELLDGGGGVEEEDGEDGEQSKIADSGLGVCDRCEGNPKLSRICSCQSLNEAGNLYDKSHNCDELDDECFERPSKRYLDIHSPLEANAHLQCHASNFELPKLEELSCLEPKIQKTLLLIMREMIGTERDYVRSLYYVIENYIDELLREDIPQPLRGQRNVIFGNIEKIFEFHNSHFLNELERYDHNPLKVGAAFLDMESKFYLYALYNKNKPKSDTLMSEYGTSFFKSKQFELADKMDLASYLLKPVQRMGKYALLLQQLVKACSTVEGAALQEIATDVEELQRAEEMVKFQLRHGNDLLAMDSLRDCDVNVKEQGRLLRQNEFLVWQGRGGKKTLRQVFLFEELVLFSKARRFPDHKNLDLYIYKHSIKTSDIGLTAHTGDSSTKFEIWFRKRKPDDTFTLQCMSEDIKNAWTEEVSKLLWKQAKRNREIRLAEMSSMGIGSKPCLDIRPSNNQINDRSITINQLNKTPKLRHSFVGLHPEQNKSAMRRPHSLISESSLSSGTSSSSISTGSSSGGGHEQLQRHSTNFIKSTTHNHGLELINETQTLKLASVNNTNNNSNNNNNNSDGSNTNTMSSGSSSGVSGLRNHKRSTTLVSQLSMESGILSDISMTPDQEPADLATSNGNWLAATTTTTPTGTTTATLASTAAATMSVDNATVILRRNKNKIEYHQHQQHQHQHQQHHHQQQHSLSRENKTNDLNETCVNHFVERENKQNMNI